MSKKVNSTGEAKKPAAKKPAAKPTQGGLTTCLWPIGAKGGAESRAGKLNLAIVFMPAGSTFTSKTLAEKCPGVNAIGGHLNALREAGYIERGATGYVVSELGWRVAVEGAVGLSAAKVRAAGILAAKGESAAE